MGMVFPMHGILRTSNWNEIRLDYESNSTIEMLLLPENKLDALKYFIKAVNDEFRIAEQVLLTTPSNDA